MLPKNWAVRSPESMELEFAGKIFELLVDLLVAVERKATSVNKALVNPQCQHLGDINIYKL